MPSDLTPEEQEYVKTIEDELEVMHFLLEEARLDIQMLEVQLEACREDVS